MDIEWLGYRLRLCSATFKHQNHLFLDVDNRCAYWSARPDTKLVETVLCMIKLKRKEKKKKITIKNIPAMTKWKIIERDVSFVVATSCVQHARPAQCLIEEPLIKYRAMKWHEIVERVMRDDSVCVCSITLSRRSYNTYSALLVPLAFFADASPATLL